MARALTDEQYGILDPHHGDYSNMTDEILSEEALQILRENDLNYLFDELLTEICIQKPRQPKLFISGWFKRRLRNPFGDYLASPKLHHSTSCPVTQEDLTNAHSPLKSTSTTTAQQEQISLSASPMLKSAGSRACLTLQLEDIKVQRAARKRTVTMLKTQKSSSPPPAVATPPSQGNGSFGNSERVVSIGTSSCARLGMLTESLQASAAVNNDGSSSVRSLSASDGQLNILGISGSRTIDIPDVTPLLRNAVSPVMGRIIYVEHAVEEQCDDPDHVAPPVDEDSGACHCDMGTITKDYRGSDFSSFHCHTLFISCKICSRRPADRLCMCCLDAFCFKHSRIHYKDDTHHSLFMNHEYIAVNYKKAFYCAACNTYTWAYVDAYEPLGDQVVVTKGTYLSHPSQDKYFRKLDVDGVVSVLGVSMQGWRSGQEDAECLLHLMDDIYLFSVFDGHGGGDVARMVAKILPEIIRKYIVENSYVQDGRNAEVMKSLLMVAFRECDEELITTTQGSDGEFNTIGCTATCVIYDHISEEIICANLGDSRATVGMLNPSLDTDLSFDHKLYNEVEEARVTAAGYKIIDGRVEGMLAVPRAFGDFDFKQSGGLSAAHQAVTCIPEITSMNRKLEGVQFLVIACDGIWDAASSKQVRDFIRRKSSECTMEQTLGMLLDRCCSSNITEDGVGTDNMSVVVVQFL